MMQLKALVRDQHSCSFLVGHGRAVVFAFIFVALMVGPALAAQSMEKGLARVAQQAGLSPVQQDAAPSSDTMPEALRFAATDTAAWSPSSPDPGGIDYHPRLGRLLIGDGEVEEMSLFKGANFFLADPGGALSGTCDLTSFTGEPIGVAVDPAGGAIFISDDNSDRVFVLNMGPDQTLCTADDTRTSFATWRFNSRDPEGLAFGQGMLFISDGESAEVYVIVPGPDGVFDGLPPNGDDVVFRSFDTAALGIPDPEGIGYHPGRGSLFLVSRYREDFLFEVTPSGELLHIHNIAPLNAVLPAGVAIGPSTRDPSRYSAYVVDLGIDNEIDPNENDGKLYEIFLDNLPPPANPPVFLPALIR